MGSSCGWLHCWNVARYSDSTARLKGCDPNNLFRLNQTIKPHAAAAASGYDAQIDAIIRAAKTGVEGIGIITATSRTKARVRHSLNDIWRVFWKAPVDFPEWEVGEVGKQMRSGAAQLPDDQDLTEKQGQYLASICTYTHLFRRPPAETDVQRHFRVSLPSVRQMIVTLERNGLTYAADRHAHQRRRVAIVLCASEAVITDVDFSRT
jgi:hypothetical protein